MKELLKKLDNIVNLYEKKANNDNPTLDETDLEILFHGEKDEFNDNAKELLFSKRSEIINILENLFHEKEDEIIDIKKIKDSKISQNTYKIIYKYLFDNNYMVSEGVQGYTGDTINMYFKDLLHYPRLSNEEQTECLIKHDEYSRISKECRKDIYTYFYDIVLKIANKHGENECEKKVYSRYQINIIKKMIDDNEIYFEKDKMEEYLDSRVKNFFDHRMKWKRNMPDGDIDFDIKEYLNNKTISEDEIRKTYINLLENEKERLKLKKYIVEHNLKLVISIAKFYNKTENRTSFADLIQEGNLGLMRALDSYDINTASFSTYATWWIRQAITRAIDDKLKLIRTPIHFNEKVRKYNSFFNKYYNSHGEKPTNEIIMKELNITKEELFDIKYYILAPTSLNDPVGDEKHSSGAADEVGDFVEDSSQNVEKEVMNKLLKTDLMKVLDLLTPQQKLILILRFGIIIDKPVVAVHDNSILLLTSDTIDENKINDYLIENDLESIMYLLEDDSYTLKIVNADGFPRTLETIGKLFNVTRERIRQIEGKAIYKLSQPSIRKQLQEYLDD